MKSTSKTTSRTKAAATASRAAEPVAPKLRMPTRIEIAKRAYEIYAKSGHQPGREVEFWLEAERQLRRGPRK
jgi:hypothetical protein